MDTNIYQTQYSLEDLWNAEPSKRTLEQAPSLVNDWTWRNQPDAWKATKRGRKLLARDLDQRKQLREVIKRFFADLDASLLPTDTDEPTSIKMLAPQKNLYKPDDGQPFCTICEIQGLGALELKRRGKLYKLTQSGCTEHVGLFMHYYNIELIGEISESGAVYIY